MEFLKNNKKLFVLGLAALLALAGAALKVDVPALLKSVTEINKQVDGLVNEPAAPPAE